MLQSSKRFIQSKATAQFSNSSQLLKTSLQRQLAPTTTSKAFTQSQPQHKFNHSSRFFSTTQPPQPPAQPQPPVPPVPPSTQPPSQIPIPTDLPPPQPTGIPTNSKKKSTKQLAESVDGAQTNIKQHFFDRRDNMHSYEQGQFQVLTGKKLGRKNDDWLYYLVAMGFFSLGMSFVAVPLYQAFCQMTGSGGQVRRDQQIDELNRYMQRTATLGDVTFRPIEVTFQATVDPNLDWEFVPSQRDITLRIGETALAFFRAKNNSDKPIIGVSTYNVLPPQAGLYFNKIQCFCFDEQRLRAGEEIDMPVFFFLDPAMADDWRMDNVDQVTLCYTFFQVADDEVEEDVSNDPLVNKALNVAVPVATQQTKVRIITDVAEQQRAKDQMARFEQKNAPQKSPEPSTSQQQPAQITPPSSKSSSNPTYGEESLICPIIPPTAQHNPSGISLATAGIPRQTLPATEPSSTPSPSPTTTDPKTSE